MASEVTAYVEPGCSENGCTAAVDDGCPVRLCPQHLALASDWFGQRYGVHDVLPSACVACGAREGILYPSGWVCATCEWAYGTSPDDELPPPRVDVVYYIRFGDRVKIGTSNNLPQRMARLWHEQLLAIERGGRSRERQRHEQFAAWRLGTSEWFAASPEVLTHTDAVGAGVDDPWQLYARWRSEAMALRG